MIKKHDNKRGNKMSRKLNVKDWVELVTNKRMQGMVVGIDRRTGRYKVLWDRDWNTGRTWYHGEDELRVTSKWDIR